MKNPRLFLFVLMLFPILGISQDLGKSIMDACIQKLENSKAYTLKVAEAMPEEKYGFKATEEEMTFGAQLLHMSNNLAWLSTDYLGGGNNPISKEDKAATDKAGIIAIVTKSYDYALQTLKNFNPHMLMDTVKFFAGPMNKFQILNLMNDHQTHHRGQILVYLRLNGIKPPGYVGW